MGIEYTYDFESKLKQQTKFKEAKDLNKNVKTLAVITDKTIKKKSTAVKGKKKKVSKSIA